MKVCKAGIDLSLLGSFELIVLLALLLCVDRIVDGSTSKVGALTSVANHMVLEEGLALAVLKAVQPAALSELVALLANDEDEHADGAKNDQITEALQG